MYGTLRLFPVFISPIVWNMYGIWVNIFNMNRYISKSYTRSKNTIFRAGAAVVSTITSLQYIGEIKRNLKDRFNEHRRPIFNPTGNYIHTAVSEHFLTSNHSDNHMLLIPIEKLKNGRDSFRKAREAHLIHKAKTIEPLGINKRDEL